MGNFTQAEALKEIRSIAKRNGLTFKRQNATINEKQAYMFTDRKTGQIKGENFTFWSAYANCMNGYIDSLND